MDGVFTTATAWAAFITVLFLVSLVLSLPVLVLWNWLMPAIFDLREITWLEAWGIQILAQCLFTNSVSQRRD